MWGFVALRKKTMAMLEKYGEKRRDFHCGLTNRAGKRSSRPTSSRSCIFFREEERTSKKERRRFLTYWYSKLRSCFLYLVSKVCVFKRLTSWTMRRLGKLRGEELVRISEDRRLQPHEVRGLHRLTTTNSSYARSITRESIGASIKPASLVLVLHFFYTHNKNGQMP
jgi:hypothetical protein